ncbi:TetR/AcrR family transcriptional regulator [Paenibacillus glycanilyticus]|uniref:TetR/AcrR family transcriptional regulator n=1 Tax=Paenibacillus glycanilyticus TaxID=126569 RepID=UPI002041C506|nr:TetR/AcrR family transcriptional regulator [Paenibacillus glycanilyticus]MCM3630666.1 TetR/AcrR family transcriptional regulator [Paenibacillus glycanilyticus]
MNGFEKRAEQLKAKIRTTVLTMLQTCEPKNIRIADIAAEAGVSQVTIYNYFGSKEDLIRDVFKQYVTEHVDDFEVFMSRGPTFQQFVEYVVLADKEAFSRFSPEFIQQMMSGDPGFAEYVEEVTQMRAMPLMHAFIEECQQQGQISDKVSTEMILTYVNMFVSQSQKLLEQAQQSGKGERFFEEFLHLFFYGVCGLEPEA